MDRQLIKSLIDALAASDLFELEYTAGGETLRLAKGVPGGADRPAAPPPAAPSPAAAPPPAPAATALPHPAGPPPGPQDGVVPAPAYGIVHLQRTPGAPPLAAPGDRVEPGQVLCLIEAMKVFAELRAERAGTIAAVLVESGQEVEAGQPLFRMSA